VSGPEKLALFSGFRTDRNGETGMGVDPLHNVLEFTELIITLDITSLINDLRLAECFSIYSLSFMFQGRGFTGNVACSYNGGRDLYQHFDHRRFTSYSSGPNIKGLREGCQSGLQVIRQSISELSLKP